MSIRTTAAEVAAIIETDSSISLTPFIAAASALVDTQCEALNAAYTAAELLAIETWLAAHLYAIRDRSRTSESVGSGVSQSLQHVEDLGFNCNEWGQMAMRLDYYGGLARLNESIKKGTARTVSVTWLGKRHHHH